MTDKDNKIIIETLIASIQGIADTHDAFEAYKARMQKTPAVSDEG